MDEREDWRERLIAWAEANGAIVGTATPPPEWGSWVPLPNPPGEQYGFPQDQPLVLTRDVYGCTSDEPHDGHGWVCGDAPTEVVLTPRPWAWGPIPAGLPPGAGWQSWGLPAR